jgi:hypothetical protein
MAALDAPAATADLVHRDLSAENLSQGQRAATE